MDILKRFKTCPVCGGHLQPTSEKSLECQDCGFEYFINASAAYVALIYDDEGRLLTVRRKREPALGTLDLPGGFADMDETAEDGVKREVLEETNLTVTATEYLFSQPNRYLYSGIDIPTLDLFFRCSVADTSKASAADDAAEILWIKPEEINPADFGLNSIREGIKRIVNNK